MPIFALFERAIRLDARRRAPYALRALLLAGTLLMVISGHLAAATLAAPGKVLFASLVGLNTLFILVACIPIFVGCIAEEKEEQMLGLLRMTQLSAGAILLGKAASRFVLIALVMASQIPFFLMAITLGGVALDQLRAAVVALAGLLILVASVSVLWSILCRRGSIATLCSFFCLLTLFFLPYLLYAPIAFAASHSQLANDALLKPWIAEAQVLLNFFTSLSPLSHLMLVMSTGYSGSPFTPSLAFCLIVAALCFGLAWLLFDIATRKPTDSTPARTLGTCKGYLPFMAPERTWASAVFWKDFFFDTGGKAAMILKTFVGLVIIAIVLDSRGMMSGMVSHLLGVVIACEVAIHASRMFSREIQQHTLNSLYTLPDTWGRVCRQKIAARLLATSPLIVTWGVLLAIDIAAHPDKWYRLVEPASAGAYLLLIAYVSCFISLRMRWGAWLATLPLVTIFGAIVTGILYAVFSQWMRPGMASEPYSWMAVMLLVNTSVYLAGSLLMHVLLRQRLRDTIQTG